jgi:NADH-quinone oxidoreductase subunit K
MISIEHYLALATIIFFCGAGSVLFRRNLIFMLMGIELMFNAVNLIFVSASTEFANLDGQVMTFFIITVAICETAVGLAMLVAIYKKYGNIGSDFLRVLRG